MWRYPQWYLWTSPSFLWCCTPNDPNGVKALLGTRPPTLFPLVVRSQSATLPVLKREQMQRRTFITLLGGAAVAWPFASRAEQPIRIGLLNSGADNFFVAPFVGKLAELGYLEGKNIVIERKFAEGNSERLNAFAA